MKMEKCREDIKVLCLQRSGQERKLVFMSPLCLIITVLLPLAKFKFVGFPYKRGGGDQPIKNTHFPVMDQCGSLANLT